jgi:LmbE family N-acetylglucosaminyl deacetylase
MNVLAIGSHPDDIEVCCAGTLLKYRQAFRIHGYMPDFRLLP